MKTPPTTVTSSNSSRIRHPPLSPCFSLVSITSPPTHDLSSSSRSILFLRSPSVLSSPCSLFLLSLSVLTLSPSPSIYLSLSLSVSLQPPVTSCLSPFSVLCSLSPSFLACHMVALPCQLSELTSRKQPLCDQHKHLATQTHTQICITGMTIQHCQSMLYKAYR